MKTSYATVAYIILCLDPTSSAQLRPRGLAATNTHATEPDSAWSDTSPEMSLAKTTSMNFIEANNKGAKVRAQGLSAKAGESTKGENDCPASEGPCFGVCLEALANNSSDCPADTDIQSCVNNETDIGELCGGDCECGTTKRFFFAKACKNQNQFNNCGGGSDDDGRDIYRRIECKSGKSGKASGKSGKASGDPGGNPGATCANVCLDALPNNSTNCPSASFDNLSSCYSEVTDIGEYCWGDGECGTSSELNNCDGRDVYLRVHCDCLIVN